MTTHEILQRIKVFLENPDLGDSPYRTAKFYITTMSSNQQTSHIFCNKTVERLLKFSQKLSTSEEKQLFWDVIGGPFYSKVRIIPPNVSPVPITRKVYSLIRQRLDFIFMFFVKSGKIEEALNGIKNKKTLVSPDIELLKALIEILEKEPSAFNENNIESLDIIIKNIRGIIYNEREKKSKRVQASKDAFYASFAAFVGNKPLPPSQVTLDSISDIPDEVLILCEISLKELEEQISKVRLRKYDKELEDINIIEINQDKKIVQTKIKELGFEPDLNTCLDKFDEDYQKAIDEFDFKACIGHLRTFIEKLSISIALLVSQKNKIPPSEELTKIGRARNYLRDNRVKFLTKEEDELLGGIYGVMSDASAHSLTSRKEYVRLAKNYAIEFSLFLIRKVSQ
ncbi:MAG: hypothetical protein WC614_04640 [bacterium]